uniref:NADH dehydrogenase subunit 5 n=1 Tax=Ishige okamurae TaxID=233772 RepID=UPI002E7A6910|nr:NADH dehydrogenase subunit 5 [Ishige okamurae]WBP70213.1 NADH dehydrogenase subunit 5 [Ishige okamurae]
MVIGFSSISLGLFGRVLGKKGSSLVSVTSIIVGWIFSCFAFYEVGLCNSPVFFVLNKWFGSGILEVSWAFCFDSLTVTMIVVVTSISSLVHLYSVEYMSEDPHIIRFLSYLSLFTFFMLVLVTSDNFIQMFVGWEGVGLSSYLLINFWFTRIQANKAAIKAMLINRVGDFGLVLGIFCILVCFGSIEYATVFALSPQTSVISTSFLNFKPLFINLISFFIFIGAVGKSAQLGLHTWLPDAMEGPTPVSALIHAATMVTAGVFLLARCSPLLEYAPSILCLISTVGGITAFFAATIALVQNDIKRVIAYSTCSQLGYMVFACGLSNYSVAVFHLSNHAFFKALLFLGAGSIIHAASDEQDMRKLGGLSKLLPLTYTGILIGSLALMGIPFLTGFYSKDTILEISYAGYSNFSHFSYFLGSAGAFCTAFYSLRLIVLCFLTYPSGGKIIILNSKEGNWPIKSVLSILTVLSIFIGFVSRDLFIGLGTDFWGNSIFILPNNFSLIDAEFLDPYIKSFPSNLSAFGGLLSFFGITLYWREGYWLKTSKLGLKFYNFFNRKWFFDKVYNEKFTQHVLDFSYRFTYKLIDRGLIESMGPFGLSHLLLLKSNLFRLLQSGLLYHYSLFLTVNFIIFSTLLVYPFLHKEFLTLCLISFGKRSLW